VGEVVARAAGARGVGEVAARNAAEDGGDHHPAARACDSAYAKRYRRDGGGST